MKKDLTNNCVVHVKKQSNEFLQFKRLLEYKEYLSHAYSLGINKNYRTCTVDKKNLPKDVLEENINNYKLLCLDADINCNKIIKTKQQHTDIIKIVDSNEQINNLDVLDIADGLVTDKIGSALATTNADCILLLFFDPIKKVIANVHSGWKGTLQEISGKAIKKMVDEFGCEAKNIIVCICPSIRKCHFEVDEEVYDLFNKKFEKLGNYNDIFRKVGDKWHIDTVLINKLILKNVGILEKNIEDCNICSVCNKDIIHSFRAEGAGYGLATALISFNKI